jgi:hypothetical protein
MLTKPNLIRLIAFTLFFAGALYYPVREVVSYERPRTPPRIFRFQVDGAKLNEKDFEIRPKVSGRWQWVDYIFPRAEKANKLRLNLKPSTEPGAPRLNYVYYPMSRDLAKETLPRVKNGEAELVIKLYPNGRWRICELVVDGEPVKERKLGGGAR